MELGLLRTSTFSSNFMGGFGGSSNLGWSYVVVPLEAGWIIFHRCIYWILLVLQCSKGRYLKFERFDQPKPPKNAKLHPGSMTCFSCASDSLFSFSNSCDFVWLRVTSCDFGCRKLFEKSGTIILPSNPQGFPSPARSARWKLLRPVCTRSPMEIMDLMIRLEKDWVELLSIAEFSSNCIIYIYIYTCMYYILLNPRFHDLQPTRCVWVDVSVPKSNEFGDAPTLRWD